MAFVPKQIPRQIRIVVDSREQRPLLFPDSIDFYPFRDRHPHRVLVSTAKAKLDAGDYLLEGYEALAVVERKGSMSELYGNLFSSDFQRANDAFKRLSDACIYPYLLLDFSLSSIWTPAKYAPNAPRIMDALCWTVQQYGLRLWFGSQSKQPSSRRRLGEVVARVLFAHAYYDDPDGEQKSLQNLFDSLTNPKPEDTIDYDPEV